MVQRTEYFGGGSDILSDDPYAVEAVRERYYAPSLGTVVNGHYHCQSGRLPADQSVRRLEPDGAAV